MNKPAVALAVGLSGLAAMGCSPEFWRGGDASITGAGSGYELRAHQQMQKLDEDLKAGRIDQREYDARKGEIQKGSFIP